jgi:hypothetical protein
VATGDGLTLGTGVTDKVGESTDMVGLAGPSIGFAGGFGDERLVEQAARTLRTDAVSAIAPHAGGNRRMPPVAGESR